MFNIFGRRDKDNLDFYKRVGLKSLITSPLTHRVLAVNVLALVFLALGTLYLKQYQTTLFEKEIDKIQINAYMIATAIGEGAVIKAPDNEFRASGTKNGLKIIFLDSIVKRIIKKYAMASQLEINIFNSDARIITKVVSNEKKKIYETSGFFKNAVDIFEKTSKKVFPVPKELIENEINKDYPENVKEGEVTIKTGRNVVRVFEGESSTAGISLSVPIFYFGEIVGAVQVSKDTEEIEKSILDLRLKILKIFLIILAITIVVSLYLSKSIIAPLVEMSQAAMKIAKGRKRIFGFPDFKNEKNEIGELSSSFKTMTKALWYRMDAIERFAADVSHEIKNPLTSIRSATETLEAIKDEKKQEKLIKIIKEDLQRVDKIISDISNLSKLDSELSRDNYDKLNIFSLISSIKKSFSNNDKGVEIFIRTDKKENENIEIKAPETRISQVFTNLVQNALSFSPKKGKIIINLKQEQDDVVISIADEGKGITQGKEKEIFQRFYSERPKGYEKEHHSGLGLPISLGIVRGLGGKIKAKNIIKDEKVIGAKFVVVLPIERGEKHDINTRNVR